MSDKRLSSAMAEDSYPGLDMPICFPRIPVSAVFPNYVRAASPIDIKPHLEAYPLVLVRPVCSFLKATARAVGGVYDICHGKMQV